MHYGRTVLELLCAVPVGYCNLASDGSYWHFHLDAVIVDNSDSSHRDSAKLHIGSKTYICTSYSHICAYFAAKRCESADSRRLDNNAVGLRMVCVPSFTSILLVLAPTGTITVIEFCVEPII